MPELSAGDTAWMLIATALVLFMTPGLAFFYGGMVRAKNVLGMLMQNFFAMGLLAVLWTMVGFTLAFGRFGDGGWIGDFSMLGLKGVGPAVANLGQAPGIVLPLTIPLILFATYQMTFAIITPALITGATADRFKFTAYAVFIAIWLVVVYAPVAHWVFGGGWLAKLGALDFAGGAVVHINAGAAALALVLLLGKRKGWPKEGHPPHSMPLVMLGTGILWFGWFGFNAGSALAANGQAAQAFMNTFLAAAAAGLVWVLVERIRDGHATNLGAASGIVAGLVAITPAAGFVSGAAPLAIGAVAGVACCYAVRLKVKFGYDDALDVVGVHFVGGLVGSLLIGVFANPEFFGLTFKAGLIYDGGLGLLGEQGLANGSAIVWSFLVTGAIMIVLKKTMGIRVSEETETNGLDFAEHAETAYH